MRSAARWIGVVVAVGIGVALLVLSLRGDGGDEASSGPDSTAPDTTTVPATPNATVEQYLAAWERSDWPAMAQLVVAAPDDFEAQHTKFAEQLRANDLVLTRGAPQVLDDPTGTDAGRRAVAPFTATMTLSGLGEWSYDGELELVVTPQGWRVDWSSAAIHPALALDGFDIRRSRVWPPRASILDVTGAPMIAEIEVVEVGVEPQRITDRVALAAAVEAELAIPPAELDAALDAPGVRPDFFVPLASLLPAEWEAISDRLLPVPGVIIRDSAARTVPYPEFARHVIGRVGEATAERLDELGPPYAVGDLVGFGGIEGRYETRLAGAPTGSVRLLDDFGEEVDVLAEFPGATAQDVATTIDPAIQAAADSALSEVGQPAAIVAVDGSGRVRASASRPIDGFDRALSGRYPPGSTFKIVTTLALLTNGVTPETIVPCPSTIEIGGRTFSNFEGGAQGDIDFATAFRTSCNTAFMAASDDIGADALAQAATTFGFDSDYDVGLTTFGGSFPAVADRTENVAAAIGQGRVEASPLHMASVAAAVASGRWNPPALVTDPAIDDQPEGYDLDPFAAATIRDLMTQVTTSGTGTAANVPGRTMGGKTGTAQFDPSDLDNTHAWFVGWVELADGPLGFAVLVEEGGVGGRVAAPIAHDFVAALP